MLLPFGIFLRIQEMDIQERSRRRAFAIGALWYPAAVRLSDPEAVQLLKWARQDISAELGDPGSASFSNERVVWLPDGAYAGGGTVECTNVVGTRVRNGYVFYIRPDGFPFLLDMIDFDPIGPEEAGATSPPSPPPLPGRG